MSRTVYVVPHTHWDREWYQPHELFRWRLVQMVDELLDHMEAHPEYRCFNLDGQAIVIDDYLALRPEQEERLRRLIAEERIVIGPWWVQPDEFLPSGESHIRSFQKGIRFAEELGACLLIGHCADQFGHIAQMPQLMAQLGLSSACLWRGVPDAIPGWSFRWRSPDGTELPVLYLRNSYSSGWRLPTEPDALVQRVRRQERGRREDEPLLLMNGTDHSRIEKHVPAALAEAAGQGYDFRLATLPEYERAMLAAGIDDVVHEGELRSPDNSNVLVGVLSARMPLKQRDFAISSWLERIAEPLELLAWLHGGAGALPALRHAWALALENTPHDSICGCSVDQVHREMLPRYDRAEQLARQVARESLEALTAGLDAPDPGVLAVFRPVPFAPAVVHADVPARWGAFTHFRAAGGELLPVSFAPGAAESVLYRDEVTPQGVLRHLDFIRENRYDVHALHQMTWRLSGGHLELETRVGEGIGEVDVDAVRREIREAVEGGAVQSARVSVLREATRTVTVVLPASEAIGVEVLTPVHAPPGHARAMAAGTRIANETHEAWLDRRGRLHLRDLRSGLELVNACAFVSEADRGDEYNADTVPGPPPRSTAPEVLACAADGVVARLRYAVQLELAAGLNRQRTRGRRRRAVIPVTVEVRLAAGVPRIDFEVVLTNTAEDHRLRALFPLPFTVETALTENHFHVAERPLAVPPWNGRSAELPPTTFPQKTFAAFEAGGLGVAVCNRGLPEGEVLTDARGRQAYALTLLRCVGWLSRNDLATRRGGAGPMIATPEAQCPGEHRFSFSVITYAGGWRSAEVLPLAHAFAHGPFALPVNPHDGGAPERLPLAQFGAAWLVPSALHRSHADGAPILRVFSAAESEETAHLSVPAGSVGAGLVDLRERHTGLPVRAAEGWAFPLRPWQIQSLRFGRASP